MITHQIKKVPTISGVAYQAGQAVFSILYKHENARYHALLTLLDQHKVLMGTVHISYFKAGQALCSFALPLANAERFQGEMQSLLGKDLENIECHSNQTRVSVVGVGVQSSERVFSQVHHWLAEKQVCVRLVTSSESRLSFYVDANISKAVIKGVHGLFHLQEVA